MYRGCGLPNFQGTYFYSDFCSGRIKSFKYTAGNVTNHLDRTAELTPTQGPISAIVSFGEDGLGELYIVSISGSVYKIVPLTPTGVCGNNVIEPAKSATTGTPSPATGAARLANPSPRPPTTTAHPPNPSATAATCSAPPRRPPMDPMKP